MRIFLLSVMLSGAATAAVAQETPPPSCGPYQVYDAQLGFCTAVNRHVSLRGLSDDAALPIEPPETHPLGAMSGKSMMESPLGPYGMNRDASGTAWQPDATPQAMHHDMKGEWMIMRHADLSLVYDHQGGPRGDEKTYVAGMVMIGGWRPVGQGALNLRAMFSPDPLMGKSGYPLLLQSGETADGVSHLIDRQHPHELFMELSASLSQPVGKGSAFVYAGLPGEPAFGPPAFMHRPAASMNPEAPISHHWLDSTHITFGVLTAGYIQGNWKIEASSFKGREPDENRYDIESPKLDSWSTRLSWNPAKTWSAQVSYAELTSPEQLDPAHDQGRVSASLLYANPFWSASLAWGSKKPTGGDRTDALLGEAAWTPNDNWTVFGRLEQVEQNELDPSHTIYRVGKASIGAIYDMPVSKRMSIGFGAVVSKTDIPAPLSASYGGQPTSGMGFVRLRFR